jgi:putative membrane protein
VTPEAPALLPKDQAMLDQLKALDGEAFQAKYIMLQTEAHKQAVALFSKYAQSGDDPALKEFAKKTLPTLRMHEKHLRDVAAVH